MKQLSFSTLFGSPEVRATESTRPFATDAEAKAARDAHWKQLRKQGIRCERWVLKNQLRKYWSFGIDCGQSCTVYMIDVFG